MDVHALRTFVEVARQQGFTRASETLHVTQPAISKIVPGPRGGARDAAPRTASGAACGSPTRARIVLERAQGRPRLAARHRGGGGGARRAPAGAAADGDAAHRRRDLLPAAPRRVPPAHPGIAARAARGGLARRRGARREPRPRRRRGGAPHRRGGLRDACPSCATSCGRCSTRSHPLARRRSVALRELAGAPFVLYRPEFALHGHILDACRRAGFKPTVVSESSHWDFIVAMVAANIGVALLPQTICRRLDERQVRAIRLAEPGHPLGRRAHLAARPAPAPGDAGVARAVRGAARRGRERRTRGRGRARGGRGPGAAR